MIVAGFGCRSGATLDSFRDALALAGKGHLVTALAAPADRERLLAPLADALGLPFIPVPPDALAAVTTATASRASFAARGTGSVAEAAALAAAGPDACLLTPRHIASDRRATCAIAKGNPE